MHTALSERHAVSDYRGIRAAVTPLRANDEYTYDLCVQKTSVQKEKKDTSYFKEQADLLRKQRLRLVQNITSAAMGMDDIFGQVAYKQMSWFISWNNDLNLAKDEVCQQELIPGKKLLAWEKILLREMKKAL